MHFHYFTICEIAALEAKTRNIFQPSDFGSRSPGPQVGAIFILLAALCILSFSHPTTQTTASEVKIRPSFSHIVSFRHPGTYQQPPHLHPLFPKRNPTPLKPLFLRRRLPIKIKLHQHISFTHHQTSPNLPPNSPSDPYTPPNSALQNPPNSQTTPPHKPTTPSHSVSLSPPDATAPHPPYT